jgi:hypothetical protein
MPGNSFFAKSHACEAPTSLGRSEGLSSVRQRPMHQQLANIAETELWRASQRCGTTLLSVTGARVGVEGVLDSDAND